MPWGLTMTHLQCSLGVAPLQLQQALHHHGEPHHRQGPHHIQIALRALGLMVQLLACGVKAIIQSQSSNRVESSSGDMLLALLSDREALAHLNAAVNQRQPSSSRSCSAQQWATSGKCTGYLALAACPARSTAPGVSPPPAPPGPGSPVMCCQQQALCISGVDYINAKPMLQRKTGQRGCCCPTCAKCVWCSPNFAGGFAKTVVTCTCLVHPALDSCPELPAVCLILLDLLNRHRQLRTTASSTCAANPYAETHS